MDYFNLANVNIDEDKIIFEGMYKSKSINEKINIYFEDEKKVKYKAKIQKAPLPIVYTYFNDEKVEVAKVLITLTIKNYKLLNLKIENGNVKKQLKIYNNKNQIITTKDNPYVIFTPKIKICIMEDGIEFSKRKFGDKFKYELTKQKYSIKKYHKLAIYRFFKGKRKYYLFNDRLKYADDNAEEMFRYVNENEKDFAKNSYFVLEKGAECLDRLKSEGKVVEYASFSHKVKYINCKIIISSHASYLDKCYTPFTDEEMDLYKDIINKKFVFIPHGVVKDDVRIYLNRELIMPDLITTSLNREYEYLTSKDYMYEKGMVIKTGLSRFDKLKNDAEKVILFSPTWRNYGENYDFKETDYYKTYIKLLKDKTLDNLLSKNGYRLKFLLHPVFLPHIDLFKECETENIKIIDSKNNRYCDLFNECAMLVTDYSSIYFDVAKMKKPIVFFQFDRDYFFKHHYSQSFFSYENDAFGEIITEREKLLEKLQYYINNNFKLEEKYLDRIDKTFAFVDNKNSQRIMKEVYKLDKNTSFDYKFNNVQ